MERVLPDWLVKHLAEKKAKEELRVQLLAAMSASQSQDSQHPDAMPEGSGGSRLSTPSCSQSSEEDDGNTLDLPKLRELEERLFQRIDPPSSPQEGFGSQDSTGTAVWSETSLPSDFDDFVLTTFIIENMSKREIRELCKPYPIFSPESLRNNGDFHADLRNGLRDHLYVCYRIVYELVKKLEAKPVEAKPIEAKPLVDVSNSPSKQFVTPTKTSGSPGSPFKESKHAESDLDCPSAPAKPVRSSLKRSFDDAENAQPSTSDAGANAESKRVRFSKELATFSDSA